MRHHLIATFREVKLRALRLKDLQGFLNGKAAEALSRSSVAHLRWDLHQLFKVAKAEGYIEGDPTQALYTPRGAEVSARPSMAREEVQKAIAALAPREQLIAHLSIFAGMRPGEILALQRKHVNTACTVAIIAQRLYRGEIDSPKTTTSHRKAAIPPAHPGSSGTSAMNASSSLLQ